jgi:tRNA pseudouridine55 synthase
VLFVGEIEQLPPMVSAIRVGGERLHRLARRGLDVERPTRRIRVHRWDWLGIEGSSARFRVVCSSGTYVRTLAHDLGAAVGVGAALESLRRLRSEPFGIEQALPLDTLESLDADEVWSRAGATLEQALDHLPALELDAAAEAELGYGRRPQWPAAACAGLPVAAGPRSVVFRSPEHRVLALGELRAESAAAGALALCPHVVFPWAVREGGPK